MGRLPKSLLLPGNPLQCGSDVNPQARAGNSLRQGLFLKSSLRGRTPDLGCHLHGPLQLAPLHVLGNGVTSERAGETALRAEAKVRQRHIPGRSFDAPHQLVARFQRRNLGAHQTEHDPLPRPSRNGGLLTGVPGVSLVSPTWRMQGRCPSPPACGRKACTKSSSGPGGQQRWPRRSSCESRSSRP